MFCATTASIVSGALAERIKLNSFLVFVVVLTALIYPIQASWTWGEGFLDAAGFSDFAGSTIVHSVGGWAALVGAIILGPRIGKYAKDGKVTPIPGSNLALATLGTFILWMGWFGFNGGSELALGTADAAANVSRVLANTNAAAAAGAFAALVLTQVLYKKADLTLILNGALGGLVAITAEPLAPGLGMASLIGAVGGIIVVFAVPMLDRMKIDDVVGAVPVHLFAGIWGTLAVVLTNDEASLLTQIYGIVVIGGFVIVTSAVVWLVIKATMGLRVDAEAEVVGLDKTELGMEAYPDFRRAPVAGSRARERGRLDAACRQPDAAVSGVRGRMATLAQNGCLSMRAEGDRQMGLMAEWRGGLARITVTDDEADAPGARRRPAEPSRDGRRNRQPARDDGSGTGADVAAGCTAGTVVQANRAYLTLAAARAGGTRN
jgi:ammonium transporter